MKWEKIKLGTLCKMNSGGTPRRNVTEYYGGDIPWAKIGDIENARNGYIHVTDENITQEGLNAIGNKLFSTGTLLLAMYGSVGKTAFAGVPLSTNQAILGIKVLDESTLNVRYLRYWLDSIKNKLLDRAVGGTLQNISLGIVKELEIPLPPLHIQEQIADTLDKADALRKKDQELLQKYDELAQAIFYDMFGDPETNEKGWPVKTLEEVTIKLGDGLHGTPVYDENGEYFFINGNNLSNGIISYTKDTKRISHEQYLKHKKPLTQDSLLVSINGTIGNVAFYNGEKIILGKSACYFNINRNFLIPDYVFYLISSDYFLKYATSASTGSTIKNVSLRTMRDLPVPLPPLEIQNRFKDILVLYKTGFNNLKSCKNTNGLYSTLMNRFFS